MKDPKYGISYLEMVKQRREAARAQRESAPKPPTLEEQIESWYTNLSEAEKLRAWSMRELKAIFGASAQLIGSALWDAGWSRRRSWKDSKPTARHWIAPKSLTE